MTMREKYVYHAYLQCVPFPVPAKKQPLVRLRKNVQCALARSIQWKILGTLAQLELAFVKVVNYTKNIGIDTILCLLEWSVLLHTTAIVCLATAPTRHTSPMECTITNHGSRQRINYQFIFNHAHEEITFVKSSDIKLLCKTVLDSITIVIRACP